MSDSDSDSEVHGSSNGESDFEGFSVTDVRKAAAASARGRRAARPSTSTAVPMDTDDSSESEWDSDCSTQRGISCSIFPASRKEIVSCARTVLEGYESAAHTGALAVGLACTNIASATWCTRTHGCDGTDTVSAS